MAMPTHLFNELIAFIGPKRTTQTAAPSEAPSSTDDTMGA